MTHRHVAVILAAGNGARSGLDYPKQFLRVGGRTILEHTIQVFDGYVGIDRLIIVASADWLTETQELLASFGCSKPFDVVVGGETRQASTRSAVRLLMESEPPDCKVLIHDGVRPLLDVRTIEKSLQALDEFDAIDVVIETADTIVEVRAGLIVSIPERTTLRRGQTPQGFRLGLLADAYNAIPEDVEGTYTDDCSVVLAVFPKLSIKAVEGTHENIKITRPVDIYLVDRLLQGRQFVARPREVRANPLVGCTVVIGGTSGIGLAIVKQLQAAGEAVVAVSRSSGAVDVRSEASIVNALTGIRRERGPIGSIVNTAGVLTRGALLEIPADRLSDDVETNLVGSLHVARASHPFLAETRGQLLLFTSSSYTRGRANYATYSASKAGVVNVTQALAEEWLKEGIHVNAICPSRTDTPMRRAAFGEEEQASLLTPEEVATMTVAVLMSKMTGHIFDVRIGSGDEHE